MIQFQILSGKSAGTHWVARRFPFRIGRAAEADLRLSEPGVWDGHARVEFVRREGFHLHVEPKALASVNGAPVEQTRLRNGDIIDLGGARVRFWLAPVQQHGVRPREWAFWGGLALLLVAQALLIERLMR